MILAYVIAGGAMAGGGWLFHHFVRKQLKQVTAQHDALAARLDRLEKPC
jgi:hypothetical protein